MIQQNRSEPITRQIPTPDMSQLTRMLLEAAGKDSRVREAINPVLAWKVQPLDPASLKAYNRLRRPGALRKFLGLQEGAATLMTMNYMRAMDALIQPGLVDKLQGYLADPNQLAETVRKGLARLGERFDGDLLVQFETEASQAPAFGREVTTAMKSLEELLEAVQREPAIQALAGVVPMVCATLDSPENNLGFFGASICTATTFEEFLVCLAIAAVIIVIILIFF
ncbi:hypothetical protein JRI60_48780 [Archangium violaceum]|uniref:hypothetical protein n=1 Tax=Archangium violaceum TaxID=83451 RepID=UPI00194F54BE|nr:hypothetical protein [Archangium violaceum]QRN96795.1 hypothetical protein JRI60_48780 [Archangium violaceum]